MFASVLWNARPMVAVRTVVVAISEVTLISRISLSRTRATTMITTAVMMFLNAAGKLPRFHRTTKRSP